MKRAYRWELLLLIVLFAAAAIGVQRQTAVSTSAAETTVLLPIAMYHSVTTEGDSPGAYVIAPSMLENDLKYLKQRGYTAVTVEDLLAYVREGKELPEKPVMLTFDDGYYNNYKNAYPLLKKYGMCAVLSPVGSLTEQFSRTDDPKEHEAWSYCTGSELKEMADSGVIEIQNHSYDFHELKERKGCLRKKGESAEEYRALFFEDTRRSQELFASLDIVQPVCYTYPYGARSTETDALVKECGFAASFGCEEGVQRITHNADCLTCMRRYNRDGRLTSEQFWEKLLDRIEEGA